MLQFIQALYQQNACELVVGGRRQRGFELSSGIRQGCPLSPLVFAIAADLLLRRIQRLRPRFLIRAYADDLAMVVGNGLHEVKFLHRVFGEFALLSGLVLSLRKRCGSLCTRGTHRFLLLWLLH